jgi:hypothetical protein
MGGKRAIRPGPVTRVLTRTASVDLYDAAALIALAALAVLVLLTFTDYAVSNDEAVQHRYGQLILGYYTSGFANQTLFHFDNLYLYGGLFDIVAIGLGQVLPFEIYDIRHVLCAFTGIGGIVATWATARLIAGPRAGLLALLALAVCGPWFGSMFNHTKDIPFAAAMMGATYFLLRAARDLPRPRQRDLLIFGLLLGCALGMRATGLLMVGYAGLLVLLRLTDLPNWNQRASFVASAFLRALPAAVLAYGIMIAAWPWAALEPLNPFRAIFAFAHFHYPIETLAFGETYDMGEVPRWYVPAYLAIKLPLTILTGAFISIFAIAWAARSDGVTGGKRRLEISALTFISVFPVLCQVIGQGPAFTGMRHFMFVVPPLAALAGIGFDAMLAKLETRSRLLAASALAGVAAAFLLNAVTLVRLHPYEYLFFNSLVSGLEGASRRFDMDYWSNIMPEAVNDLESFLEFGDRDAHGPLRRYLVAVCGPRESFEKEAKDDPRLIWTEEWDEADFFISSTQMNCDRRMPGETIATIERFGVPIGVVKDRRILARPGISRNP